MDFVPIISLSEQFKIQDSSSSVTLPKPMIIEKGIQYRIQLKFWTIDSESETFKKTVKLDRVLDTTILTRLSERLADLAEDMSENPRLKIDPYHFDPMLSWIIKSLNVSSSGSIHRIRTLQRLSKQLNDLPTDISRKIPLNSDSPVEINLADYDPMLSPLLRSLHVEKSIQLKSVYTMKEKIKLSNGSTITFHRDEISNFDTVGRGVITELFFKETNF